MHPIINIAVKAARQAGTIIVRAQDQIENLKIIEKGRHDYVSQVDKAAEAVIIDTIKKAYPHHSILGEESGLLVSDDEEIIWIIDPLDGTTNFLRGFPHFCISIALKVQGKVQHGVIYDPVRDELFTASRGQGAQVNGKRLRVSKAEKIAGSLLGTGFPYRDFSRLDAYLDFFKTVIPHCAGIRRAGAAALDLAYVAAGRLDGFWEFGLSPWDVAAGGLMIQEAGGWVTTISGQEDYLNGDSILAGTPKVYQQMLETYKTFF